MLTFEPESHTYRWNGEPVPSVTQILEAEGISDFSMVPADVLATAQARGTAVHLATQYLDENRLDWSTVSDEIGGYVLAWERFKKELQVTIQEIEIKVFSKTGYAGTVDRIALVDNVPSLLEIKSGSPSVSWRIQTAAYRYAHPRSDIRQRCVVQLKADGSYRLLLHDVRDDEMIHDLNVFMAALTLHHFKRGKK